MVALRQDTLKTARAWASKEHFCRFWDYVYPTSVADFFRDWHGRAVRRQLSPIRDKAKMLKRHLESLLSYFRHPITNAVSEGFNSRIQSIKSAARGFDNFDNHRTRILFYCGKLNLKPPLPSH